MSDTTTQVMEQDLAEVAPQTTETTALVPIDPTQPEVQSKIAEYRATLDMGDTNSIIFFGSQAQQEMSTVSADMLEGVRNKDAGPAGDALTKMVGALDGIDLGLIDPNKNRGFFSNLFSNARGRLTKFKSKYDHVETQIDNIIIDLEGHKTTMLTDIEKLDRLYDANLDYFHDLEAWILAGEEELAHTDAEVLPALRAKAEETGEMLDAQAVRDMQAARDDLERRVHDLKLTRQVTMQSLPSIRLVQENDKALVNKINSVVVNTVPLWQQQLAQAIAIFNSRQTGKAVEAANDLTNELLKNNADNLQVANREVREQIERGVYDVGVVQAANDTLIATIQESLQIAEEAKVKRREAETAMQQMEHELKETLRAASASGLASAAETAQAVEGQ